MWSRVIDEMIRKLSKLKLWKVREKSVKTAKSAWKTRENVALSFSQNFQKICCHL